MTAREATPPLSGALPSVVAPAKNVTEPVGGPTNGTALATVAVKVTAWPYTVGFIEEDSAVVVPAWATLIVTVVEAVV